MLMKLLSFVAPNYLAKKVIYKFRHPSIKKLREHELKMLKSAEQAKLPFRDHQICTYRWKAGKEKENGKVVFLVHGWEGQAGNFADFIPHLLNAGFDVFAFDAPGHGFTESKDTSIMEFLDVLSFLLEIEKPAFLVSHSFGGVACTYALSRIDLKVNKYLLFATPNSFAERIRDVAAQVGVSNRVLHLVKEKLQKESETRLEDLSVAQFVQKAHVAEALILHDKNDQVIGIEQAETVHRAWSASKMLTIEGTGHFRILRDQNTLEIGLQFLNGDQQ
ncbi:MAG: alpha/beta hydrolase [Flavobacteriales bacterium]|nr:alpha/beta hydrolase [Flavobacteriales bacterium]